MSSQDGAPPRKILITGANGHLGRHLLAALPPGTSARALVRSQRARAQLDTVPAASRPDIVLGSPSDAAVVEKAADGCDAAVHLVGIIKEGRTTKYATAHEETCRTLVAAAQRAGIRRIVYLSIVGASQDSSNPCLASKARAETILLESSVPSVVLRAPMVLGRGDIATASLRGQALAGVLPLVGGGRTLQQPIDARDVLAAIRAALAPTLGATCLEIAGPECLSHRALVERVAALHGRSPRVVPIPLAIVRALAGLLERTSADPPITRAMLDVIQHDDEVDAEASAGLLGFELTSLDDTLRYTVGPEAPFS